MIAMETELKLTASPVQLRKRSAQPLLQDFATRAPGTLAHQSGRKAGPPV
jgi:hypothetical protein